MKNGKDCIPMSRTQGKHAGFGSLPLRCSFMENPRGSPNLKASTPTSWDLTNHFLGVFRLECLSFPPPRPQRYIPGEASGFFPGPERWTGPLRQFGSRAGAGGRGPNTSLISSVKEQISTDRAFTDGGPTQKICLKLGVSGQKDQKGSCAGSPLGFSSRDLCLPAASWASLVATKLCRQPGLRGQEVHGVPSCGHAGEGCLPPFLPHG